MVKREVHSHFRKIIVSYGLNISVCNLLTDVDFSIKEINTDKLEFIRKFTQEISLNRRIGRKLNTSVTKNNLEKYLIRPEAISMNQVAEEIGYDKRTLYRLFPNLCKEISSKYQNHIKQNSISRKKMLCEAVEDLVDELWENNIYPSRRCVELYLNKEALLKESTIKAVWKRKLYH